MFADMTISGFNVALDIVVKTESVAMIDGAMATSKCVIVEHFLSVRRFTLNFPMS